MATSIEQVKGFLDEHDLNYAVDAERDAIVLGFNIDPEASTYRDEDDDPYIRLVVRVLEGGEFVTVFSPNAWNIDGCVYKAAVLEALVAIQMQYKLLRFDYDMNDGEIRRELGIDPERLKEFFAREQAALPGTAASRRLPAAGGPADFPIGKCA